MFVRSTLLLLLLAVPASAQNADGFRPMFNGKNLDGWVNVNCHPGTFYWKDGMLITTGEPTGFLRTQAQYQNFVCEFDWMHQNKEKVGNSGFFVWADPIPAVGTPYTRGIEVQVLVNLNVKDTYTSHGDIFSIHGADCTPDRAHPKGWKRCLPSENLCKVGDWNHYKVTAKDGAIKLEVNGKLVSGVTECNPRKGYLAFESEGAECWFKNVKIKELPSTQLSPKDIADVDNGLVSTFTGLDFTGWKWDKGHETHWTTVGGRIKYDGKSAAEDKHLWTTREFGDVELVVDWRFDPKHATKKKHPVVLPTGEDTKELVEVLDGGNSGIYLRGDLKSQINICCYPVGSGEVTPYRTDKSASPEVRAGVTPKMRADKKVGEWNRFVITLRGDRLSVKLNGQQVIENAHLPGIREKGPIGLQHHGEPIEFMNLFVRELPVKK